MTVYRQNYTPSGTPGGMAQGGATENHIVSGQLADNSQSGTATMNEILLHLNAMSQKLEDMSEVLNNMSRRLLVVESLVQGTKKTLSQFSLQEASPAVASDESVVPQPVPIPIPIPSETPTPQLLSNGLTDEANSVQTPFSSMNPNGQADVFSLGASSNMAISDSDLHLDYACNIKAPRPKITEEELGELCQWMKNYTPQYPAVKQSTAQNKILVFGDKTDTPTRPVWFIGDIHGDAQTVVDVFALIDTAERDYANPLIVFLGDVFDRWDADGGYEATVRFLLEMKKREDRVVWIRGNHDDGLLWNEAEQGFASTVYPASFFAWLNEHPELREFGLTLTEMIKRLPFVVMLPGGVMASHGGFPQGNLLGHLQEFNDLEHEFCLRDFQTARVDDSRYKEHTGESGQDEGAENFTAFCERLKEIGGPRINRIVSAHQHFIDAAGEGKRWLSKYFKKPSLSLYSCTTLEKHDLQKYPALKKVGKATPCLGLMQLDGELYVVPLISQP